MYVPPRLAALCCSQRTSHPSLLAFLYALTWPVALWPSFSNRLTETSSFVLLAFVCNQTNKPPHASSPLSSAHSSLPPRSAFLGLPVTSFALYLPIIAFGSIPSLSSLPSHGILHFNCAEYVSLSNGSASNIFFTGAAHGGGYLVVALSLTYASPGGVWLSSISSLYLR